MRGADAACLHGGRRRLATGDRPLGGGVGVDRVGILTNLEHRFVLSHRSGGSWAARRTRDATGVSIRRPADKLRQRRGSNGVVIEFDVVEACPCCSEVVMARVAVLSPRARETGLFLVWAVVMVAIPPGLLMFASEPDRMLIPMLALSGAMAIPLAIVVWLIWCHNRPATRQMAARHHQLRDLLERADGLDVLSAGDVVLLPHDDYDVDEGMVEGFLRVAAATQDPTVISLDAGPSPRKGELFVVHRDRPVVSRREVPVMFTATGRAHTPRARTRPARRRPRTVRQVVAHHLQQARHARAGAGVATLRDLDELITQVREALSWPSSSDDAHQPADGTRG